MKMLFTCVAALLFCIMVTAQPSINPINLTRIGEVLGPSPNAASLGTFGGIPVNHASGAASVSVPLYEIKTSDLSVPISLSYTSSGFVVDEVASRVGISWALNIGGVITRTVYDGPDELSTHLPLPAGFNTGSGSNDVYDFLNTTQQSNYDLVDMQPDIFSYNFGQYNGRFIIKDNEVIILDNSDIKIRTSLIEGDPIDGCHFKVTTPDGVIYYFGNDAAEMSGSESFGYNCGQYKDFEMNGTAWYIKKIVSPSGDFIDFYYSGVNLNYKSAIHESQTRRIRTSEHYLCPEEGLPDDANSLCVTTFMNLGVRLDQIITSNGQKVVIEYRTRNDLPGDYQVDKISLYRSDATTRWKYYQFNYQEIITTGDISSWVTDQDPLKRRMFLTAVAEKSDNETAQGQVYKFEYTSYDVPPRLSFTTDYWGYYNGKSGYTSLYLLQPGFNDLSQLYSLFTATADRTPDAVYSQKGLLNKVIYPTGGWDSIIYEGHTYKTTEQQQTNVQNITVSVNEVSYGNAGPTIKESTSFTPSQDQRLKLHLTSTYFGQGDYEPPIDKVAYSILNVTTNTSSPDATLVAGNNVVNEADYDVFLTAGNTYKIILKVYGIEVTGSASLSYKNYDLINVTYNKPAGGVRVAKVYTRDAVTDKVQVKKYFYSWLGNFTYSSCDNVAYDFDNITVGRVEKNCGTYDCRTNSANYFTLSSNSFYNIRRFGGRNVSYRSVVESLGENFENGGTEYLYTSEPDEPPVRRYGALPVSSPFTNVNWYNALNTYQRNFSYNNGNVITRSEQTTNQFVDPRGSTIFPAHTIRKNYTKICYYENEMLYLDGRGVSMFDVLEYNVLKRWVYPKTITTKTYESSGNGVMTSVLEHEYANAHNLKPTKIKTGTSLGENKYLRTTYAADLFTVNQPQWLGNLKTKGYSGAPIEQLTIKTIGGVDYVLGGQLYIYDAVITKPALAYKLEISSPILLSQFTSCAVNNGVLSYDPRYKFVYGYQYNSSGNLVQKSPVEVTQKESYIWDYKNLYPVAGVVNAGQTDIAYASFEADGTGNWTVSSSSRAAVGFTGNRSYQLSNGNISKSGLNTTVEYVVSYWSTGGPYTITGTTGNMITGKTVLINGVNWTYYQHKITAVNSLAISGGSGFIDELRLYPANAQMTTYTYEPFVGMTGQCNPGNVVSRYEYDGFGRLKIIRDQDNNILKTFDYKYQQ